MQALHAGLPRGPECRAGRGQRGRRGRGGARRVLSGPRPRGVDCRDPRRGGRGRGGRCDHGGLAPSQSPAQAGGDLDCVRGPGRAGARGSDRGPALVRRRGRGDERFSPVAGADDARGVAIAQGEPEQAGRDAHDALATAASSRAYGFTPDTLECLAALAVGAGGHREAARLYGAADAIRQRGGFVRFKIFDAAVELLGGCTSRCVGREGL